MPVHPVTNETLNHCPTGFPEPLQELFETNANGTPDLPNTVLAKVQDFSDVNFMLSKPGLVEPSFLFFFLDAVWVE